MNRCHHNQHELHRPLKPKLLAAPSGDGRWRAGQQCISGSSTRSKSCAVSKTGRGVRRSRDRRRELADSLADPSGRLLRIVMTLLCVITETRAGVSLSLTCGGDELSVTKNYGTRKGFNSNRDGNR